MKQQNVFRVSSVIYAGNNYDISPRQIHRKVIQDALFSLGKEFVSVGTLAEYINQNYSLLFSPEEIMATFTDSHFSVEFEIQDTGDENRYQLTEKRRLTLSRMQKKTLQCYIDEYLVANGVEIERGECVMQFLYNMFTSNVDSYERLLQTQKISIETNNKSVTQEDALLINGFLDWDEEEKNVEIFNLACYALEYCLLTGKGSAHFTLEKLRNKTFYLDTNIIYRAIGINGEDRKKRTLLFLSKFKSLNNEIKLTNGTLDEFENSLKNYIKKLRQSETPAIHSSVYSEYVTMDDIWRFYHVWRAKRSNGTVDYFANYLKSEFQSICEKYQIEVDSDQPFIVNECEQELNANAASIKGLSDKKTFETAYYDAINVKWVECKRAVSDRSIFDTKYFLLSSDCGLRFWDVRYHSVNAPVVILPSQWLSIILRYMERTSDDFKSFVCFLNIKTNFDVMTEEQIHSVLQGISEVTTDMEQQGCFLRTIVENDFKDGAKDLSNAQIRQISKKNAERLLQKQLDDVNNKNASLEKTVAEHEEIITTVNNELETTKQELDRIKNITEESEKQQKNEITILKDTIETTKKSSDKKDNEIDSLRKTIFKIKKVAILFALGLLIVGLVGHIIWYFCAETDSSTYMGSFIRWIKGLDDPRSKFIVPIFGIILSAILIPSVIKFFKICCKKYTPTSRL